MSEGTGAASPLKNRFYIGEVTYRGEVHRGEYEPILGREFQVAQAVAIYSRVTFCSYS